MNTKYTPGPWEIISPAYGSYQIRRQSDKPGYHYNSICSGAITSGDYGLQQHANARLIATAPELLEKLKEAENYIRECQHDFAFEDNGILKEIHTLIIKAEGE